MPDASSRDSGFDLLKGIGVLGVLTIHSTGQSSRLFALEGTGMWWAVKLLNAFANWAVPLFLVVSAILWARSVERKPGWERFYRSRAVSIIWPLVVWSVLYWLFRFYVVRNPGDTNVKTVMLPGIGDVTGPAIWVSVKSRLSDLFLGKAYFHLYFMAIILQLMVVFPFLVRGVRRLPSLAWAISGGIALQAIVFWVQREVFRLGAPASTVFWHLVLFVPGVWIGVHWLHFRRAWPSIALITTAIALVFESGYLVASARQLARSPVLAGPAANWLWKLYPLAFVLAMVGASLHWTVRGRVAKGLEWLGQNSLAIYLFHPMPLYFFGGPRIKGLITSLPFAPIWAFGLLLVVSVSGAAAFKALRLEGLLFGRPSAKPAPVG